MAEYLVQDTSLTAVADKIREITNTSEKLNFPDGWKAALDGVSGGEDLDAELANQDELIEQIMTAIEGKVAGGGAVSGLLIDWGVSGGVFDGDVYAGVYTTTGSMVIE